MNVFKNEEIAGAYDAYYQTQAGKEIDAIEEKLIVEDDDEENEKL